MIQKIEKEEFYEWIANTKALYKQGLISKEDNKFIGSMRIAWFYKNTLLAYKNQQGEILGILTYTITKGYFNIYYHYTLPTFRSQGISTAMYNWVLENETFDRIYARASTPEAVIFYTRKNFTFYGKDADHAEYVEKHLQQSNRPIKSLLNITKDNIKQPKLLL